MSPATNGNGNTAREEPVTYGTSLPALDRGDASAPPDEPALVVRGLTKEFGRTRAVDDLSFTLLPGRIYAFVGPNGAGKTTTMRMVATLEEPTAGEITVSGLSAERQPYEVRRILGYMPDHYGVYPDMTIRDYLQFYGRAYELPPKVRDERIDQIMDFTGLNRIDGKLVEVLSKGMKQRLNMGRALLNDPQLLVLDEPAAGLDPRARIELRYLLKSLAGMGKTIFISSHILSELAEMCDSMLIIDRGRIVTFGTVEEIQSSMREHIEVAVTLISGESGARLEALLLERPDVSNVVMRESGAAFHFHQPRAELPALLQSLCAAGLPIIEFKPVTLTMEDVFMQITQAEIEQ